MRVLGFLAFSVLATEELTQEEISEAMAELDKNGDKKVSFAEMYEVMSEEEEMKSPDVRALAQTAFSNADKDGSSFIEGNELMDLAMQLDEHVGSFFEETESGE